MGSTDTSYVVPSPVIYLGYGVRSKSRDVVVGVTFSCTFPSRFAAGFLIRFTAESISSPLVVLVSLSRYVLSRGMPWMEQPSPVQGAKHPHKPLLFSDAPSLPIPHPGIYPFVENR